VKLALSPIMREQLVRAALGVAVASSPGAVACGGPCKEVAAARVQLEARPAVAAVDPHARVRVPYAAANRAIAEALADPDAMSVPVPLGRLSALERVVGEVRAVPREVRLGPAGPGRVRIDVTVDIVDRRGVVVTFDAHTEVAPVLERAGGGGDVFLSVGLDPRRVEGVELELGPRFTTTIRGLLAARAVEEVGEEAWKVVRSRVLPRLSARTRMRVRLPDVPIERVVVSSLGGAVPALDLAIMTSLPVRAGLATLDSAAADIALDPDAVDVRLAGSTVAELANWAIATGRAPQRYTRKLKPAQSGDFVPLLDWRPGHQRPLVVSIFQIARGCSCFSAGVRARVEVRGDDVVGTIEERRLELALGPPHIETLAWLKDVVDRSIQRSKKAAAHTELTVGDRTIGARVVDASVDRAELHVAVHLAVRPRLASR
jgi:hypothetical protein